MTTRLNISIQTETAIKLKKIAPKRGISKFLTEAAEEKINKVEREKALKELLEAPPTFTFLKGKNAAVNWVGKLRAEDEKRLKRIWDKNI